MAKRMARGARGAARRVVPVIGGGIRGVVGGLAGAWMVSGALLTAPLGAQGGAGGAAARSASARRGAARPPMAAACRDLVAPSGLVRTPEGLALVRLQRELASTADAFARQADASRRTETARLGDVQRGVDSLLRVVVRAFGDSAAASRTFVLHGADGVVRGNDGAKLREQVEASIRRIEPQVAALAELASASAGRVAPGPAGWLGVGLSGSVIRTVTPEGELRHHCDYPVVETVDPGSPAERAGLAAGDTIVAYNGRDVTAQPLDYAQLLVPGQTLRVRLHRGGAVREVPVQVVPRRDAPRVVLFRPGEPGRAIPARAATGGPPARPVPPAPAVAPALVPGGAPVGVAVIAGAQLSPIDEEFSTSVGLEPGLLVLRAPVGSPAAEAGVRAGDVIVAVNGAPSRELAVLQRALAAAAREVTLTVVSRGASARTVTLRR